MRTTKTTTSTRRATMRVTMPAIRSTLRRSRVKREEARRAAAAPSKRVKQPALDLMSGEYQLPALSLLAEPVVVHDAAALSDDALEENARMLEAVLADFGVKGRIMAVRP